MFGIAGRLGETDGRTGIDANGPAAQLGVGIEQRTDGLTFGAALTAGRSQVDAGKLSGDTRAILAGLYGRWQSGPVFVAADLFGGNGKVDDLTRDIGIPTFLSRSNIDYRLTGAELEAGWQAQHGPWSWSLSGLVRATRFHADPFRETGAAGLNLAVSDDTADRVDAGIGAHVERAIPVPGGLLTLALDARAAASAGGPASPPPSTAPKATRSRSAKMPAMTAGCC